MSTRKSLAFDEKELSKFTVAGEAVIRAALALEWSAQWQNPSQRVLTLRSRVEPSVTINVPTTNLNAKRVRAMGERIIRYSDPNLLDKVAALSDEAARVASVDDGPKTALGVTTGRVLQKEMAEFGAHLREVSKEVRELPKPSTEVTELPKPSIEVTVRPWMARRYGSEGGRGLMYESKSVLEVTHGDGSITYRCVFCDFENGKPRSVSSHVSRSKKGHDLDPVEPTLLRVNEYRASEETRASAGGRPSGLRSRILAALSAMDDWSNLTRDDLADRLSEALASEHEPTPAEPLTDAQIVARITALIDNGRLAQMHQQMDDLTAALAQATQAREAAEHRAETLRSNMAALRDLISDEDVS